MVELVLRRLSSSGSMGVEPLFLSSSSQLYGQQGSSVAPQITPAHSSSVLAGDDERQVVDAVVSVDELDVEETTVEVAEVVEVEEVVEVVAEAEVEDKEAEEDDS